MREGRNHEVTRHESEMLTRADEESRCKGVGKAHPYCLEPHAKQFESLLWGGALPELRECIVLGTTLRVEYRFELSAATLSR